MFPVNNLFRNVFNRQAHVTAQALQTEQARLQTLIDAIEQNQTPRAEALDNLAAFIVTNDQGAVTSPQMQEAVEYLADNLNDHEVVMFNRAPWGAARLASFAADDAVGFLQQGTTVENRQRLLRCINRLLQQAPEDRDTFELRGASFSRAQLVQFVGLLRAPARANNANARAAAEYERIMGARGGWDAVQNVHAGVVEAMAVDVFNHMTTTAQAGLSVRDAKAAVDNWLQGSDFPNHRRTNARSVLYPTERTAKHDTLDQCLPVVVGYVLSTPDPELRENLFLAMAGVLDELGLQGRGICSVGWRNRITLFPIGIDLATNQFGANEEVNERVVALAHSSFESLSQEVDDLLETPGLNVRDISGLIDAHRQNFVHASVFELVLIGGLQLNTVMPAVRQHVEVINADIPDVEQAGEPTDINLLIQTAIASILPPVVQPPAQPAVAAPHVVRPVARRPVAVANAAAPNLQAVPAAAPDRLAAERQEQLRGLRYAIDALDIGRVTACLENINGRDLDLEVVEGKTALQYLISEASETDPRAHLILNSLCDAGIDVNKSFRREYIVGPQGYGDDSSFPSALETAIREYKVSFVEALLAKGADPNFRLSLGSISDYKRGIEGNCANPPHPEEKWIRALSFVRSAEFASGSSDVDPSLFNLVRTPSIPTPGGIQLIPIRKRVNALAYRDPGGLAFIEMWESPREYREAISLYHQRRLKQLNLEIRNIKALRIEKALMKAGASETLFSYLGRTFN